VLVATLAGPVLADDVDVGLGNLPPGKTVTIRFGARIADPVSAGSAELTYQGTVAGANFASLPTDDPDTAAPADATVTPLELADLALTKSGAPDPVLAGGTITYTLTLANAGPRAAGGVSLVDALPSGTRFLSLASPAGFTCSTPAVGQGGSVSCSTPSLALGTIAVFTLAVTVDTNVPGGTSIVNTASVASATADPSPGNEQATSVIGVGASADLAIAMSGSGALFPGSNVVYSIVVSNQGPDAAAGVVVADPTPPGLSFVSNTGACTTPFPCALGALASGQTRAVVATFNVPSAYAGPDPISNTATVSGTTLDANATNDAATVEIAINLPAPGLSFHTLSPCRLVDTRLPAGPRGGPALPAPGVRVFPLAGACGVPASAKALSVNVTVTEGSAAGHLFVYAGGPPPSIVSSTGNWAAGQTRANNAIVSMNRDGELSVFAFQASGTVHFILDVNGYFE
jgi:uncharacterized repeat protein (TIGR01451 family)